MKLYSNVQEIILYICNNEKIKQTKYKNIHYAFCVSINYTFLLISYLSKNKLQEEYSVLIWKIDYFPNYSKKMQWIQKF